MALPIGFRYYDFSVPVKELFAFYDKYLRGYEEEEDFSYKLKICQAIDSFVDMPRNEMINKSILVIINGISESILRKLYVQPYVESYVKIRTKLACAMLIQHALKIEHIKDIIWEEAPKRESYGPNGKYYEISNIHYEAVPKEYFETMRTYIDEAHSDIERIREWLVDDNFRQNALTLFSNKISWYYQPFGLQYTYKKKGDKSSGCLGVLLFFISFIVLFYVVA